MVNATIKVSILADCIISSLRIEADGAIAIAIFGHPFAVFGRAFARLAITVVILGHSFAAFLMQNPDLL
jgi:hypothetical protein